MKYIRTFVLGILAGIAIGIGGMVYLASLPDYKPVGAFLFSAGLMTICFFSLNLYTGKVCYLFDNKPSFLIDLLLIWIGNYIGAGLCGIMTSFALDKLSVTAESLCNSKLSQSPIKTVILGFFCGILVFIAVDIYKRTKSGIAKYIGIFTCIPLFIIAGFEHSIADMFYFSAAHCSIAFPFEDLKFILLVTLGNSLGGLLVPVCLKYIIGREEK